MIFVLIFEFWRFHTGNRRIDDPKAKLQNDNRKWRKTYYKLWNICKINVPFSIINIAFLLLFSVRRIPLHILINRLGNDIRHIKWNRVWLQIIPQININYVVCLTWSVWQFLPAFSFYSIEIPQKDPRNSAYEFIIQIVYGEISKRNEFGWKPNWRRRRYLHFMI